MVLPVIRKSTELYKRDGLIPTIQQGLWFCKVFFLSNLVILLISLNDIDIVDRVELRNFVEEDDIWYFSEAESCTIDDLITVSESHPQKINNQLKSYGLDQPFVCKVGPVQINSRTGAPVGKDGTLFLDTIASRMDKVDEYYLRNIIELLPFLSTSHDDEQPAHELDCAVIMYTPFQNFDGNIEDLSSKGPHGWVQTHLPKIEGIEKYSDETGKDPILILPPNPSPYAIESLEALGYTSEDWITWDGKSIRVNNLVIPSIRRKEYKRRYHQYIVDSRIDSNIDYKFTSGKALKWLRNEIAKRNDLDEKGKDRRVFISRSDATWRQVSNYEDIEPTLREYGFEPYVLSEMSFLEQFKLFKDADVVLGVTGAGLSNIAFSDDCKVIVLYGEDTKPTYPMLARSLGLECGYLLCDPVGGDPEYPLRRNLNVDESELLKLFNIMDITETSDHEQIEEPQRDFNE